MPEADGVSSAELAQAVPAAMDAIANAAITPISSPEYRVYHNVNGTVSVQIRTRLGYVNWDPKPVETVVAQRQRLINEIISKCWSEGLTNVDGRVVSIALEVLRPSWDYRTGRKVRDIAIPRLPEDQLGLPPESQQETRSNDGEETQA